MNDKLQKAFCWLRNNRKRYRNELRRQFDSLTRRQRLWLVGGLFALFALFLVVDVWYVVSGFGNDNPRPIEMEHITSLPIKTSNLLPNDSPGQR